MPARFILNNKCVVRARHQVLLTSTLIIVSIISVCHPSTYLSTYQSIHLSIIGAGPKFINPARISSRRAGVPLLSHFSSPGDLFRPFKPAVTPEMTGYCVSCLLSVVLVTSFFTLNPWSSVFRCNCVSFWPQIKDKSNDTQKNYFPQLCGSYSGDAGVGHY